MISSSPDVLSDADPMFWGSNGGKTILDGGDKSKDKIEHYWTSDGQYRAWIRLKYISPAIDEDFNEQSSILIVKEPYASFVHFLVKP